MRVTHLHKSGSGMASKTACGRNILRTPFAADWVGFKQEPTEYRCIKCTSSKQFEVNTKMDAKKASFNHNAPYNPQFFGAQPARAGEDY